jgi:hypothetical protein
VHDASRKWWVGRGNLSWFVEGLKTGEDVVNDGDGDSGVGVDGSLSAVWMVMVMVVVVLMKRLEGRRRASTYRHSACPSMIQHFTYVAI